MPRTARLIDSSGGYYHVTCRGNNKSFIFKEKRDYFAYLSILAECKKAFNFRLFNYAIMGNHVHLILSPQAGQHLQKIMKAVNQSYTLYFKSRHDFIGRLWQDRYKSFIIDDDAYLLTAGIYVELNPLRANLVQDPADYQWSSYRANAFGEPNSLVDASSTYFALAERTLERQAAYRALAKMWGQSPREPKRGQSPIK